MGRDQEVVLTTQKHWFMCMCEESGAGWGRGTGEATHGERQEKGVERTDLCGATLGGGGAWGNGALADPGQPTEPPTGSRQRAKAATERGHALPPSPFPQSSLLTSLHSHLHQQKAPELSDPLLCPLHAKGNCRQGILPSEKTCTQEKPQQNFVVNPPDNPLTVTVDCSPPHASCHVCAVFTILRLQKRSCSANRCGL